MAETEKTMTGLLREYIYEKGFQYLAERNLPTVGKGRLYVDYLNDEGDSMSLQWGSGEVTQRYIDGTEYCQFPFSIYFKRKIARDNDEKIRTIEALNKLGTFFEEDEKYFGEKIKVLKLQQVSSPNIIDQNTDYVIYLSTYMLEFNKS